jgi:CDP-paratose synthetase
LSKIIYTTGLTGFIGQNVLKNIINDYDITVNFGRDNKINIYQSSEYPLYKDFNFNELEAYPSEVLIHLATHYNPKPKNFQEERLIAESNFNFPLKICNSLKKIGLKKIISTSSYMQLLDLEYQNLYAKTKNHFITWAKSEFEVVEIFLFDTFGFNDPRNKVLDVFIKSAIIGQDINIPSNRIDINLTHVEEVSKSLVNSTKLKPGQYMIMSDNQTTVKELARRIISLGKTSSKIKTKIAAINFLKKIDNFPKNIYKKTIEFDFNDQVTERFNEIKKTNSL